MDFERSLNANSRRSLADSHGIQSKPARRQRTGQALTLSLAQVSDIPKSHIKAPAHLWHSKFQTENSCSRKRCAVTTSTRDQLIAGTQIVQHTGACRRDVAQQFRGKHETCTNTATETLNRTSRVAKPHEQHTHKKHKPQVTNIKNMKNQHRCSPSMGKCLMIQSS